MRDDPKRADDWRRLVLGAHLGLGDAIQAGNHLRGDLAAYRDSLDHYRRALAQAETLVASQPAAAPDLHRLARSTARTAGILAELGARTGEAAQFDESLGLHRRTVEIYTRLAAEQPQDGQFRRNLADAFVMRAHARTLAGRELPEAQEECARAIALEEALAAADPANAEAQQDLSFAYTIAGQVSQARGERAPAAQFYQQALEILEPLVSRFPGNVETAFDLARARHGLTEVSPAEASR